MIFQFINNPLKYKKKIIFLLFLIFILKKFKHIYTYHYNYINCVEHNFCNLSNYFDNINKLFKVNEIYFNITSINYYLIHTNNIYKVEYNITFYDKNINLIEPSDLTLFNNLHIVCIKKEIKPQIFIISLANIIDNKYFNCIFFLEENVKNEFGIKIYLNNKNYFNKKVYFFFSINSKDVYSINNTNIIKPENYINLSYNKWIFIDLFNYKFCLCKGLKCKYEFISQECKYYFYLNIINNNKYIYNKTDFLFGDFIYNEYSIDDAYPVFEKMYNLNMPVHYLTERMDIFQKYCKLKKKCLTVIPTKKNEIIDGNFLEKYLTLILKLKATISGAEFFSINNLFYNIDYITHISLGHGVSFFKHFLYEKNSYYGKKKYNKILIPPSKILISTVKKYGWSDNNIIKINLPRWDKYNNYIKNENKKSIFIMFTWRELQLNKYISIDYFKNIINLINNELLMKSINNNNISLFFCFHHRIKFGNLIINKNIKLIKENEISKTLLKASLVITDFSSIIFDMIYQKKPFIIYIPDINNTYNKFNYNENYYRLIKDMKDGKIYFKNKYFNLKDVIKKIIYYINNDFKLEKDLEKFYESFKLKKNNGTILFINYINHLKI